eukprot:Polyplicarium_translucidae@DN3382_c1_g1_i4.p1
MTGNIGITIIIGIAMPGRTGCPHPGGTHGGGGNSHSGGGFVFVELDGLVVVGIRCPRPILRVHPALPVVEELDQGESVPRNAVCLIVTTELECRRIEKQCRTPQQASAAGEGPIIISALASSGPLVHFSSSV